MGNNSNNGNPQDQNIAILFEFVQQEPAVVTAEQCQKLVESK